MKSLPLITITSFVSIAASILPFTALSCSSIKGNDNRAPDVPAAIQVPEGHKVEFHTYAEGVQIYSWNGSAWEFVAPDATLYDAEGNKVGSHYAGPTWQSNSDSKVVAARLNGVASPNPNSVPWLLLEARSVEGRGIFARTTYIQRVNTAGGVAPAAPGSLLGEEARIPYTAEYYFYRKQE